MRISDWSSDVCSSDLAVAAALAHQRVDEHALGRVDHLAALAAAALLGGAGLVVDEDAHALHFAQALLHGVQLAAVEELDVIWKNRAVRPLPDFVAQHHDRLHTLAAYLVRDLRHAQLAVDRLAAGHRPRHVVADLVRDFDTGVPRLPALQRARGAVGADPRVLAH